MFPQGVQDNLKSSCWASKKRKASVGRAIFLRVWVFDQGVAESGQGLLGMVTIYDVKNRRLTIRRYAIPWFKVVA